MRGKIPNAFGLSALGCKLLVDNPSATIAAKVLLNRSHGADNAPFEHDVFPEFNFQEIAAMSKGNTVR